MSLSIKKKAIKKAVSVVTMVATIAVMSGVASFSLTSLAIADVVDGALIKSNATNSDGTPTFASLDVYIVKLVGTKKFKRLILNPTVFQSYGHLDDNDVQTVSQAMMDEYTTSGLVRVDMTIDPSGKVYAMAPDGDVGSKSWVNVTETEFKSVSGSENGDSIYTINATDAGSYTAVADILLVEELEEYYADGTLPAISVSDGELTVALSSSTPASMTLPKAASSVEVMRFNLTAGEATIVDGITISRSGVGVAADFANVYLYEGATRLTSGRSIGSSTNTVEFANLGIDMTAGEVKTLSVKVDVASGTTPTAGDVHSFEISSASVVVGPDSVLGSFPIKGNAMSIGSQSVSTVTVTKGTTPSDPTVGEVGAILSEFKLAAGANDVSVENITLIHSGTTSSANIFDLELYAGAELVASVAEMNGDYMVFDFDEAYTIAQGITRVFQVKGTLVGRSGLTVKTYLEYSADVLAVDATYSVGAYMDISTSGTFDGATTGTKYIEVTSQGGRMTIAHNGPATSDVSKGGKDVHFYKFAMTASEQQVEVKKIGMTINGTAGTGKLACSAAGGEETFTDLKIIDVDTGKTLMGPKEYVCGSGGAATTTSGEVTFTDSFYIDAGETRNLAFTVDIRSSEATAADFIDDSFATTISAFTDSSIREVDSGQYLTASTDIVPFAANVGNGLTIRSSSLVLARASTPVNATIVKRAANVEALGLNFTTGSDSAANVSAITLNGYGTIDGSGAATWANTLFNDIVSTVSLWDGATQVGVTKSPTATGVLSFTGLKWDIPAGATKKLTVKVDLTSSCDADGNNDDYFYITLSSTDVTATDKDSNTITLSTANDPINGNTAHGSVSVEHLVRSAGTLSAKVEGSPDAAIVVAGSKGVVMAKYKLSALYEGFTVEKLEVASDVDGIFTTPVNTYDQDLIRVGVRADSVITWTTVSAGVAKFSGLDIVVPTDGSVYVEILADLNTIAGGAVSGDVPRLGISRSTTNTFRAVGAGSSTVLTYTTLSGASTTEPDVKAMTLRKTVPTVAKVSSMSTTLINGANTLYGFTVVADSGATVSLKRVALTASYTASALDVTGLKLYRGTTDITGNVSLRNKIGQNLKTGGSNFVTSSSTVTSDNLYITWDKAATDEELISAGTSNTYYVKATVASVAANDNISMYIADDIAAMADGKVSTLRTTIAATPESAHASVNNTQAIFRVEDSTHIYLDADNNGVYELTTDFLITAVDATTPYLAVVGNADTIIPGALRYTTTDVGGGDGDAGVYFDIATTGAYNAATDPSFGVTMSTTAQPANNALMAYNTRYTTTGTTLYFDETDAGTDTVGTYATADDTIITDALVTQPSTAPVDDAEVATLNANFIWSDNSNVSHATTTADWTNGYLVGDLATDTLTLSN